MTKVSRFDHAVWLYRRRLSDYLRYRSPWVRIFRAVSYRLKPYGVISGGTDCDGMHYAGMALFWTRGAAEASAEASGEGAEGPFSAEVVSGSLARQWQAEFVPDTRDRFAEKMGY